MRALLSSPVTESHSSDATSLACEEAAPADEKAGAVKSAAATGAGYTDWDTAMEAAESSLDMTASLCGGRGLRERWVDNPDDHRCSERHFGGHSGGSIGADSWEHAALQLHCS